MKGNETASLEAVHTFSNLFN